MIRCAIMRWIVLLGLMACIPLNRQPQSAGPTKQELRDLFSERWVGRHEDDVLTEFGKPAEVLTRSDGDHVDSYRTDRPYAARLGPAVTTHTAVAVLRELVPP